MKTMTRLLRLFILSGIMCCFSNHTLYSQDINDSCYIMRSGYYSGYVVVNPDSILTDTCKCKGWDKTGCLYAKKWYGVHVPYGVFNLPKYPRDTTIYVTWQDIDTNFVDIRQKFIDLEASFGNYIIIKNNPQRNDSSLTARSFRIKFDNYQKIDSVGEFMFLNMDYYLFWYDNRITEFPTVIENNESTEFYPHVYPNPSSESTKFKYRLDKPANVKLAIYNSLGREIAVLVDGWQNTGEHEVVFDGWELNAGVYFYRVSVGEEYYFGKMMIMR